MAAPLTFAIPKGRILDEALPVMARAGLVPEDAFHDKGNRSLTFATTRDDARLIRVRAFDVATFVAHGAAQAGIVGSRSSTIRTSTPQSTSTSGPAACRSPRPPTCPRRMPGPATCASRPSIRT